MDDNVRERKDSIGEVLVTITTEVCRQAIFSVRLCSFVTGRAASISRICVKWRISYLGRKGYQLLCFFFYFSVVCINIGCRGLGDCRRHLNRFGEDYKLV